MLYLVGTPIGNLQDFSIRALKTLLSADIILAEDTRSFNNFYQKVKEAYAPLISNLIPNSLFINQIVLPLHDQNEFKQINPIIQLLKNGKNIALVSESGMPTFSDPGSMLVAACRKNELPITCIPGPTAANTALALSGLDAHQVVFLGFFPKKPQHIMKLISSYQEVAHKLKEQMVMIAYESPMRIHKTLSLIKSSFPAVNLYIARELTKEFEEFTPITDPLLIKAKGEFVVLLSLSGKTHL